MPPPPNPPSIPARRFNGNVKRNGHGLTAEAKHKRSMTPVSFAEPQSDSTGATVIACKRRKSVTTSPSSSSSSHSDLDVPRNGSSNHDVPRNGSSNHQVPRTEALPYSRHSRRPGESVAVSTRTYQAAIWDLGASRAAGGDDKGSGALSQPGATLSITSCMSSDFYTDDTDDTGMRAALNYPLIERVGSAENGGNRPGPALGYYRDSPAIWNEGADEENDEDLIPPHLLPSPSIRAKLRLLLSGRTKADSDISSEPDIYGSITSMDDLAMLRHQMTGLEAMYREVLRHVGMEGGPLVIPQSQQSSLQRLSSNHSANSAPRHYMRQLRHRRSQEIRAMGRRVERLENHVVTLAESVAEISSDVERLRLTGGSRVSSGTVAMSNTPRAITATGEKLEDEDQVQSNHENMRQFLRHPKRLAKLKWFFGQEPPFLKEFLASFGCEKFAGVFEKEDIGLQELPLMTEDRLKALGLPLGPRLRVLEEIKNVFGSLTS